MRNLANVLLISPLLYVIGFFIYVGLADDPGCGSREPGLCFGAGLFMVLIAPIAIITTIVFIVRIFIAWRGRQSVKRS